MKRLSPSYGGYSPATPAASRVGRGNKKTGTRPERLLEGALSSLGLRFGRHARDLPGNPDIIFPARLVAVFCDGAFWHGRNWRERRAKLMRGANADYWIAKIARNRQRDRAITRELRALGWCVIRVWDTDVCRNPEEVARAIARRIELRQPRSDVASRPQPAKDSDSAVILSRRSNSSRGKKRSEARSAKTRRGSFAPP
jgi:DNA mismatch endonuclease (patch repair protein)